MARRKEPEPYPWIQQPTETGQAYDAFRVYLLMGTSRSLAKAAAKMGKTPQNLEDFSRRNDWVARVKAYDAYLITAETDGLAHQMAESRDENLELVRKLRGHLSARLDEFIAKNQDPSIRWNQALTAMAKLEANAFSIRDDAKTTERIEAVLEKVERLGLMNGLETTE